MLIIKRDSISGIFQVDSIIVLKFEFEIYSSSSQNSGINVFPWIITNLVSRILQNFTDSILLPNLQIQKSSEFVSFNFQFH